ncbi:MAG TPA: UDP-N-acetylmuramoyl-L-alanyl-D-glutamate--2,6-diaminopimelate ligase [Candidatus Saccharimonadales bacterium]|jgi:UDP-N-acetylmuramoyl-L-alanyl-D-glutamate--2,6-diaminopimelate ligase
MGFRSLVKKLIPKSLFAAVEPYGHLVEAVFFNVIYGFPTRNLKVIGVTGTNGKSTTCFMIHRMLQDAGYNTGLMSTISYGVGEDIKPQMHHMTTVSTPELLSRIREMKKQDMSWLILETTSHALAQHRVWGVPYSIAVLTNITHEHLGYHKTFKNYQRAKLKMFDLANKAKGLKVGVINADDPSAELFASHIKNPILYGIESGEVKAKNVKLSTTEVSFVAEAQDESYQIKCHIPGSFNVSNALAAVCVGRVIGLSKKQIEQGIANLKGVEGRMTKIDVGQDFDVIVDYAHSPDSFEKLFKDLKPILKGRAIVVFGSLGGGDVGKRAEQGKLAGQFADIVIVTEEDDRKEDPDQIAKNIADGVEAAGKKLGEDLLLIHDRPKAIQEAINMARKNDMVLTLGKGHEKTIEHADGEHPWDEAGEVRKALSKRLSK